MTCDLSILTAVSLGPNMAELGVLGPISLAIVRCLGRAQPQADRAL